jgi:hypothetical protein
MNLANPPNGMTSWCPETSSRLLLGLRIGYDELEKHKDVVGLIKSFVCSAGKQHRLSELKGDVMVCLLCYENKYRCALDHISKLDGCVEADFDAGNALADRQAPRPYGSWHCS